MNLKVVKYSDRWADCQVRWTCNSSNVCGHTDVYLTKPLLLFQSFFGELLPFRFHGQTHNVLFANSYELLGLKQRRVKLYLEERLFIWSLECRI